MVTVKQAKFQLQLIGVARGKQDHDKRDSIKDKQWARDKERIMKKSFR